jgi:hypothetical protein
MIPSPALAPSSTDGLSTLHHPSSLHLVNSTHRTTLPTPSGPARPSKSPHKPLLNISLSQRSDENFNATVPSSVSPPETPAHTSPGRRSPIPSNKRKRDSEPHSLSSSQLRKAQERVVQKRAKIAARVPSAMAPGSATSTPAPVTSLADLYAQMRRDSDASDRRDVASRVATPASSAEPRNGRVVYRRPQGNAPNGAPRGGHSTTSSPDPIAMSEGDQEIVMVKHVQPSSSPQVRAHPDPPTRLQPPVHLNLKLLSKAKSTTTPTTPPKSTTANGVDKLLDRPRKPKHAFAVVVSSPAKHTTLKPVPAERKTPARDATTSQSQDPTPPSTPFSKHTERLKEITNGKTPGSRATRTPPSAPVRPTRSADSITDSIFEYVSRRPRRGPGVSEDLTAQEIDTLLGAVPVPLNFSLSHHHLSNRHGDDDVDVDADESERGDEYSPLWWHHPIFEARAKADIRRTLGALLPADPAQDPPLGASDDAGGWRAEMLPRQSGARMWAERLEDAFGPGPLNRGMGRKPRRVAVSLYSSLLREFPHRHPLVPLTSH